MAMVIQMKEYGSGGELRDDFNWPSLDKQMQDTRYSVNVLRNLNKAAYRVYEEKTESIRRYFDKLLSKEVDGGLEEASKATLGF